MRRALPRQAGPNPQGELRRVRGQVCAGVDFVDARASLAGAGRAPSALGSTGWCAAVAGPGAASVSAGAAGPECTGPGRAPSAWVAPSRLDPTGGAASGSPDATGPDC